ncbi:MAG: MlaE family ABC transporter permease [Candidatus Omnitrophota bacterium]
MRISAVPAHIGRTVISWWQVFCSFTALTIQTGYWILFGAFRQRPVKRTPLFEQMVFMGAQSVLIVIFVTFFTGIVLAMQSAPQLDKMGGTIYVASLVSIAICRELGPVLTALVLAGRIGAAITAEIGSMKVNEQIEALETMGINPVRFLVAPKVLALFLMLPCLTILGDLAGMLGGYLVGVTSLDINPHLYVQTAFKFLALKDVYTGLSKSLVFALIISLVGCYQGLTTRGGAVGVGRATTVSVVTSFILIIISDSILTGIYFFSDM